MILKNVSRTPLREITFFVRFYGKFYGRRTALLLLLLPIIFCRVRRRSIFKPRPASIPGRCCNRYKRAYFRSTRLYPVHYELVGRVRAAPVVPFLSSDLLLTRLSFAECLCTIVFDSVELGQKRSLDLPGYLFKIVVP